MGERGCGGFDPLGLRRNSPTALLRGGCGTGAQGCAPMAWSPQTAAVLRGGGIGVRVGTLALTALRAHLCGPREQSHPHRCHHDGETQRAVERRGRAGGSQGSPEGGRDPAHQVPTPVHR